MIWTLQHYSNKISYQYLKTFEITKDIGEIVPNFGTYQWVYDIYFMSDLTLRIDLTVTTPDNKYGIRQCFTHNHLYQVPISVKDFATMIFERLCEELDYKFNVEIFDDEAKEKFKELFIVDFWKVFEREYFNVLE